MKIRKPTTHMSEIGPLYAVLELPTDARKRRGMKTVCRACREEIEDTTFVGGFVHGHENLILHVGCLDEQGKALLEIERAKKEAKP